MRKLGIVVALLACFSFTSCAAGPHQLRRSVDEWDQKMYVDSPWLDAVLWVVPVYPLAYMLAGIGDFIVTDGYTFWFVDAFGGARGTGYQYQSLDHPNGYMQSMLDVSSWMHRDG